MPGPKSQSDEEVLDAAERVLLRIGPHAFTLADVARESRLSPATLVQRFGTKRGLLVAFARRAADRAGVPFAAPARPGSPLRALRRALVEIASGMGDRATLVNHLALLLEDVRDEALRGAARAHARAVEAAVAEHLEQAAARGEIHVDDVRAFARLVQATWNGAVIQWALRGDGAIGRWVGRELDALFALVRR